MALGKEKNLQNNFLNFHIIISSYNFQIIISLCDTHSIFSFSLKHICQVNFLLLKTNALDKFRKYHAS